MLSFFVLSIFHLTLETCPICFRILPKDEINIKAPGNVSYSFVNWSADMTIEIKQGSHSYGPFTRKSKVFGIYFRQDVNIFITNKNDRNFTFFIGCYRFNTTMYPDPYCYRYDCSDSKYSQNSKELNSPYGIYAEKYSKEVSNVKSPIIYADDWTFSFYYIGIILMLVISFFIVVYLPLKMDPAGCIFFFCFFCIHNNKE